MSEELEVEFEKAVEEINAKIVEAGKLLKQARDLGAKVGLKQFTVGEYDDDLTEEESERIYEADVNIYPVFGELDCMGWRTSSIGC